MARNQNCFAPQIYISRFQGERYDINDTISSMAAVQLLLHIESTTDFDLDFMSAIGLDKIKKPQDEKEGFSDL